jgi:hypothetical protein
MGLDLNLLPAYDNKAEFSHDIIGFHREYNLFDLITKKENQFGIIATENLNTFLARDEEGEYKYGKTKQSPYGEPIKYLTANHLKDAIGNYNSDSWKNKAIIAFINQLPDNLPVFIYWH